MLRMARMPTEEHPVSMKEESRLTSSTRLTRCRLCPAAAAVTTAALTCHPARTQTTADTDCSIGFVDTLLQFDLDYLRGARHPLASLGSA